MTRLNKVLLGNSHIKFIDGDRSAKYPKREEFVEDGILFLNAASINTGTINESEANRISEVKFSQIKKGRIQKNDILITTRGNGVGDFAFVNTEKPGLINAQMLILRVDKQEINPKFLFYYLSSKTLYAYIWNFASGSAQPQIPIRDLKKIPLFLPALKVQTKAAAILSDYDDLIENNKRRIVLLEKMAEEIYREWFVRFRFPGYQTAEFEKGIPKGWRENTFGNISNMVMGQSPSSEFYNEIGDGLPFHQGVGTYGYRFPENKYYCSVIGRVANKGDILFSVRAPVGRLNIANEKMIIGRGLAAISHKSGLNSYLYYFLKVAFSNEDIIGNGSIFNSVGKDELKGFKLLSPPRELEEKFNHITKEIDDQISCLINSVKNLEKTKNMLLPRLISGKLSVEHLDIQFPPSMLDAQVETG